MIAPIRPQSSASSSNLGGARRIVGAMFFCDQASTASKKQLSRRASWMVLGWAIVVMIVYLFRNRG